MLIKASLVIIAYLLGAIPFGYLLVKYFFTGGEDIRRVGSGGTGATNVTRRAGKLAGVLTLVLDAAKGALAVWLMRTATGDDYLAMSAAAIAAVAGHIFPVFLRFRGGKGVATGVGVFLALAPYAVLAALVVFLAIVFFTRYVSLGSIAAAASLPIFALILYGLLWPSSPQSQGLAIIFVAATVIAGLIVASHHENIGRLLRGTESKFGARAGPVEPDRPVASGSRSR
jgi:glycerol-3-phosphate acyltransferase PlsY